MNMLRGVTSLQKNSNSLIYWFSNSQSAYMMSMFLGGRIRGMRTQSENSWAKWMEEEKKKQTDIGNNKNTKERCHQTQTEEKRESFLEAATRAWNFKKQLGGRTEGVMEGCPHRGKSTQYLLSTASPYLGLDWAWRTRKREVARNRCGYRVNHWGPWVPSVKSLFKTEASFGRVSDTANLWFRKIILVMVWSIYKRNKNWKQEDQLRSIFKEMKVKSKWKWETDLRIKSCKQQDLVMWR